MASDVRLTVADPVPPVPASSPREEDHENGENDGQYDEVPHRDTSCHRPEWAAILIASALVDQGPETYRPDIRRYAYAGRHTGSTP
jgi:hypothetical protein